jgi:anti-sigma B factor antagonist
VTAGALADPVARRPCALTWEERTARRGARVVAVRGALVFPDSRLLAERLTSLVRAGARRLVLDLTGVTEMDNAIVGVLLAAARQLRWVDGRLATVTRDPRITRIFTTTGLDAVVEVAPTLACALRAEQRPETA